ncbi:MAG: hypothetical protein LBI56_04040 [Puniceicoccales bacterium]|jgi:hypothetical protein|nr:hypothetical protein [Puniceicoccales bacterium]
MAKWITIQASDLYNYLGATQLNALKSFEWDEAQSNPVGDIIRDVTARIRAEIGGNKNNLLSADRTTIPQDLKSFACYLILESAQTRLPALKLTADQVRLANDAREYLKRISRRELSVSVPDGAKIICDFPVSDGCEVVHSRSHHIYREFLGGL